MKLRDIFVFLYVLFLPILVHAIPLHQAVRARDIASVREILETSIGTALDIASQDGVTALHIAAATDQPEVIRLLIERGAAVNSRTRLGFTPLHWAASKDSLQSLSVLLAAGADMQAKARNDITPLHWAAARDAAGAVQMLLDAGADINAKTASGETPLHLAVRQGTYSEAAIILAQSSVAHQSADALPSLPEKEPRPVVDESEEPVAVRPGMFLTVPIGLGETLSFVWLEELGVWFGKYEVSNGQYKRYDATHSSRQIEGLSLDGNDQPVVYVSWNEAVAYCDWLTRHYKNRIPVGYVFRLPTESEWMWAASTGGSRNYPWGDDWPPLYGNYSDESGRKSLSQWKGIEGYDDGYAVTAPVDSTGMNELGVFGLAGNVWEWTTDWKNPSNQTFKVRKGASWDFDPQESLKIAVQGYDRPSSRYETIGFRIVVAPTTKPADI
jgi:hypothetical protein